KLNLIINSDRGVEVQRLVDVMDTLKKGGFDSISIATRKQ
ncbi:ExbD/TolR family protein, partial [Salmonella enterica]